MNCLKCGRTVAAGELLCPACSGRGIHPEPDTKVQEHIHQKAHEPATTDATAVIERLEKKLRRSRRWMMIFLVACMALTGFILLQFMEMGHLYTQLNEMDAQLVEKAVAVSELQAELEDTHEMLSDVEEHLAQRDLIIEAYEQMTEIPADSLP